MNEINAIDLAIRNLSTTSKSLEYASGLSENYNTIYGEMLEQISYESWKLANELKNFKERYVV